MNMNWTMTPPLRLEMSSVTKETENGLVERILISIVDSEGQTIPALSDMNLGRPNDVVPSLTTLELIVEAVNTFNMEKFSRHSVLESIYQLILQYMVNHDNNLPSMVLIGENQNTSIREYINSQKGLIRPEWNYAPELLTPCIRIDSTGEEKVMSSYRGSVLDVPLVNSLCEDLILLVD